MVEFMAHWRCEPTSVVSDGSVGKPPGVLYYGKLDEPPSVESDGKLGETSCVVSDGKLGEPSCIVSGGKFYEPPSVESDGSWVSLPVLCPMRGLGERGFVWVSEVDYQIRNSLPNRLTFVNLFKVCSIRIQIIVQADCSCPL